MLCIRLAAECRLPVEGRICIRSLSFTRTLDDKRNTSNIV